jgi:hypothetical protein
VKKIVLGVLVAFGVTAGIASLANSAAALINTSGHSSPHDNAGNSLCGPYVGPGDGG